MVKIDSYANGDNNIQLTIGNLSLYFSYTTIIAFKNSNGLVVCENVWSKTTGKHLNFIDGGNKKNRLARHEFEKQLNLVLNNHHLEELSEENKKDRAAYRACCAS